MDPPFQADPCMQKQDSQQLTEVQQSLPAGTPALSVQSSYKQSLENLNLQAWCMHQPAASPSASECKCISTAQKVGVSMLKWAWLEFFARLARTFCCVDPPF